MVKRASPARQFHIEREWARAPDETIHEQSGEDPSG